MSVQLWTYLFVFLSFSLYIGIAVWSRAGSTHDFYVAGGGVKPLVNGMATAADWMSAASFISMAGLISFLGRDGTYYLMGWTGGYVLLALLLAPYLRKFGKFTVPAFIGERYYSQSARLTAVFCAIVVSFVYVCGQMQGAGIVFSHHRGDHRHGHRVFLCRARWHEGHYLYPSRAILRPHLCLYGARCLYFTHDDRQPDSATGFWLRTYARIWGWLSTRPPRWCE